MVSQVPTCYRIIIAEKEWGLIISAPLFLVLLFSFFCSEFITGRVMGLEQDPEDQTEDRQEEVTERGRGDLGWRRGNPVNYLAVLELCVG